MDVILYLGTEETLDELIAPQVDNPKKVGMSRTDILSKIHIQSSGNSPVKKDTP